MKNIIRNGALALTVVAGAALVAAPTAMADSIQRDGYFGGTWNPIGPRNNRHVQRYFRHYGYYGPYDRYAYYGPPYRYYGAPYYYGPGPGVGFSVTIR
jgi:hypothetical protein